MTEFSSGRERAEKKRKLIAAVLGGLAGATGVASLIYLGVAFLAPGDDSGVWVAGPLDASSQSVGATTPIPSTEDADWQAADAVPSDDAAAPPTMTLADTSDTPTTTATAPLPTPDVTLLGAPVPRGPSGGQSAGPVIASNSSAGDLGSFGSFGGSGGGSSFGGSSPSFGGGGDPSLPSFASAGSPGGGGGGSGGGGSPQPNPQGHPSPVPVPGPIAMNLSPQPIPPTTPHTQQISTLLPPPTQNIVPPPTGAPNHPQTPPTPVPPQVAGPGNTPTGPQGAPTPLAQGFSPQNPIGPTTPGGPLAIAGAANTWQFFDPPIAIGYNYQLNPTTAGKPLTFGISEIMPTTKVSSGVYDLWLLDVLTGQYVDSSSFTQNDKTITINADPTADPNGAFNVISFLSGLTALQDQELGVTNPDMGLTQFSLRGIDPSAGLNPDDPSAFITGLLFTGSIDGDLLITPLAIDSTTGLPVDPPTQTVSVPEPTSLVLLGTALLSLGFFGRRRKIAKIA